MMRLNSKAAFYREPQTQLISIALSLNLFCMHVWFIMLYNQLIMPPADYAHDPAATEPYRRYNPAML